MISDIGRWKRCARAELLLQHHGEVPGVEEAGLRVDPRLGLQLRDRERAVDQDERRDRERHQPRVELQSAATARPSVARMRSVERLSKREEPGSRAASARGRA